MFNEENKSVYIREASNAVIVVRLRADGILISEEKENFLNESSVEIAESILEVFREVCGDEKYPLMSRFGDRQVGKEERRYYMNQSDMPVSRVAMIVHTPFQRLLANFLIGINKVPYETRLFTDENKAVVWLKQ